MSMLSEREIMDELARLEDAGMEFDRDFVLRVYDKLQDESNVQKYNKNQQYSLLDDIVSGNELGETEQELFRHHGSQKHLNYFDNFLADGQSDAIVDAIHRYGGSADVLRGVKPYKSQQFKAPSDPRFEIYQEWTKGDDGSSPVLLFFEVRFNGQVIYRFTPDVGGRGITPIEPKKWLERLKRDLEEQGKYRNAQTLQRTPIFTSSGEKLTEESFLTSKGNVGTRTRGANGRFVKR